MFSDRTRLRLNDIVDNADRVHDYIEGLTLAQFTQDKKAVDAVERCLSRITEAVIQLGEAEMAKAQLHLVWTEVRGLGNRLRHEYRRIDSRIIYDTARDDIPALRDAAVRALER